jgi:hypothetical protein
MQINASLPPGRRPGPAFVYVTSADGIESNGQVINISCATCPTIRPASGVLDRASQSQEIYPGAVVSIFGSSFSDEGNSVTVEQRDDLGSTHRYVLPRDGSWFESPEQINARLPAELRSGLPTLLYVTDRFGRESNEHIIHVFSPCPDCPPAIRPSLGVLDQATLMPELRPGALVAILGARFSAAGNTVVVEQADRRFTLAPGSLRHESPDQIHAALPATLVSGRALLYVLNAQGRESNEAVILLARTLPPRPPPRPRPVRRETRERRSLDDRLRNSDSRREP